MRLNSYTPPAIQMLAGQLRAARAARLADPSTSPVRRMMDQALERAASLDEAQPPTPRPTRTRKRRPTVASVLRQMQRAGVEIAGCKINSDGSTMILTGKPNEATTPATTTATTSGMGCYCNDETTTEIHAGFYRPSRQGAVLLAQSRMQASAASRPAVVAAFMAAYEAALEGEAPRIEIGASRTKPGTINALVVSYFNSMAFQALAPETRRTRRNILERFRAEHGDKRSALLKREHVNVMFAKKAATRFAARNWLKTVRALMQFAVTEGMLATDPTAGIKNLSGKTDGFRTWNEDDIAAFEARHPIGTRERLALALLVNTAQRRGDVVRMGRQHIRNGANRSEAAKDRDQAGDPDPSRSASGAGRHPVRPSDLPHHDVRQAVRGGGLHQLVSGGVQCCGPAARNISPRASQGRLSASGGSRMQRQRDRRHLRPQEPERGGAVHHRRQPRADGPHGRRDTDGAETKRRTEKCQTCAPV